MGLARARAVGLPEVLFLSHGEEHVVFPAGKKGVTARVVEDRGLPLCWAVLSHSELPPCSPWGPVRGGRHSPAVPCEQPLRLLGSSVQATLSRGLVLQGRRRVRSESKVRPRGKGGKMERCSGRRNRRLASNATLYSWRVRGHLQARKLRSELSLAEA